METSGRCEGARGRVAKLLRNRCESETIVCACFLSKTEEEEEDEATRVGQPWLESQQRHSVGLHQPLHCGELLDAREAPVEVCQAGPRVDRLAQRQDDEVCREGYGAEQLDAGECHETEIPIERQVAVRGEQLAELPATPEEDAEGAH